MAPALLCHGVYEIWRVGTATLNPSPLPWVPTRDLGAFACPRPTVPRGTSAEIARFRWEPNEDSHRFGRWGCGPERSAIAWPGPAGRSTCSSAAPPCVRSAPYLYQAQCHCASSTASGTRAIRQDCWFCARHVRSTAAVIFCTPDDPRQPMRSWNVQRQLPDPAPCSTVPSRSAPRCTPIRRWRLRRRRHGARDGSRTSGRFSSLPPMASTRRASLAGAQSPGAGAPERGHQAARAAHGARGRRTSVQEWWSGRCGSACARARAPRSSYYLIARSTTSSAAGCRLPRTTGRSDFRRLAAEGVFERAATATAVAPPLSLSRPHPGGTAVSVLAGDAAHAMAADPGQGSAWRSRTCRSRAAVHSEEHDLDAALAAWQRTGAGHPAHPTLVAPATTGSRRNGRPGRTDWQRRDLGPGQSRRFNHHMRIADRVDAPRRRLLTVEEVATPQSRRH